jgi:hypothetical protein
MVISCIQIIDNLLLSEKESINYEKNVISGMPSLFLGNPLHPGQHICAYRVFIRVCLRKVNHLFAHFPCSVKKGLARI